MSERLLKIWITGAGSGIGRELALLFARRGHTVIVSGRDGKKLETLARQFPHTVLPMPFDVTLDDGVSQAANQLATLVSHLDVAIFSAGTCEYIEAPELDIALFRRVMDTNFFGMVNSLNAASALLAKSPERPQVLGICSMSQYIGFPRAEAYGASKSAAAYLMHSLRTDFSGRFDVTVVNPGFIDTPMTANNDFPMPFLMSSERAASIIARRMTARPPEINFPLRLHLLLRLVQLFKGLWYRHLTPRMKQSRSSEARP